MIDIAGNRKSSQAGIIGNEQVHIKRIHSDFSLVSFDNQSCHLAAAQYVD